MRFYGFWVVYVFPTFDHTPLTSSNRDPFRVFLLVTRCLKKDTNVSIWRQIGFIFLAMLCLMKIIFLSKILFLQILHSRLFLVRIAGCHYFSQFMLLVLERINHIQLLLHPTRRVRLVLERIPASSPPFPPSRRVLLCLERIQQSPFKLLAPQTLFIQRATSIQQNLSNNTYLHLPILTR